MATKVTVTGYIAGGYEFSDRDLAMARAWWNETGHLQVEDAKPITKGRTPDAVLLAWVEAGEPEVEIAQKLTFEPGDRKRYTAWLKAEGKESSDETKAEWFASDKPVPDGYVDNGPTKAPSPDDVLAVIYGNKLDDMGNVLDEKGEVAVTRAMLKQHRGEKARGAASAEQLTGAANVNDAMEHLAPVTMVRGDVVLRYENGAWVGATQTKKALQKQLTDEQKARQAAEEEIARKDNELARLKELLEKAEKGINASSVKKAPTSRRATRTTKKADTEQDD